MEEKLVVFPKELEDDASVKASGAKYRPASSAAVTASNASRSSQFHKLEHALSPSSNSFNSSISESLT